MVVLTERAMPRSDAMAAAPGHFHHTICQLVQLCFGVGSVVVNPLDKRGRAMTGLSHISI